MRRSGSTLRTAVIVRPATSGKAMMVWAKTMALGVNSQCRLPIGPLRESNRYTANPTTTGGRPIPV